VDPGSRSSAASSAGATAGTAEVGVTGHADEGGFVDSVDNIRGPRVQLPWVPRRSQATLSLGTRDGRNATLIVDNWFGGHHSGTAVKWGALSNGSSLVGPAATLAAHTDAPPLPTCEALSPSRTLVNPLVATNADFPDYEGLAALVKNGADDGGWPAGVGTPRVADVKDPHSVVRGLPWHRLAHNESADFLGLESPDSLDLLYASMTERSRARYCAVNGDGINPDFRPRVSCDGTVVNGPSVRYPYCNRATAPVAIVSFDCAIVESGAYNSVIVFNVLTFDGGGRVITYNYHRPHAHPRWSLPADRPVAEFDELACVGTSVYPNAPGHLFNEILPRLIHMDTCVFVARTAPRVRAPLQPPHPPLPTRSVLPLQIPMLWPPGDLPARVLESLRDNGLISADRVFVMGTGGADLWRAKRLYVYASDYFAGHTPLILATSQRVLAARLQTLAERKDALLQAALAPGAPAPPPLLHGGIVVLLRNAGEARAIQNEAALLDALRAAHPGVKIDAFVPGTPGHSYVECASLVYGARVVIGPHGANLNNFVGALPGTFIIEVGYSDSGSPLPSDYFCQARNLGLRYWLSMADSGCYGCGVQVNVDDILEITKKAFAE
jgi:hypothetical protein